MKLKITVPVAIIVVLAIALLGVTSVITAIVVRSIDEYGCFITPHPEDTCEGPDNDYTYMWYVFRMIDIVDTALQRFCSMIHREDLFFMWRAWMLKRYNITIY